jgi:hypothetical protein
MRLELELARAQESTARTQERLMQATNVIANLHGTGMVALILGKPDAILTHTEVISTAFTTSSAPVCLSSWQSSTLAWGRGWKIMQPTHFFFPAGFLINYLSIKAALKDCGVSYAPCRGRRLSALLVGEK